MAAGAGVFSSLCCIVLLLGVTPVVTVLENTVSSMQGARHHRQPFGEFKTLVRKAVQSGKIRRITEHQNNRPPPFSTSEFSASDFMNEAVWREFDRDLSTDEWGEFESLERAFRHSISTKDPQNTIKFTHRDYRHWRRLFECVHKFFYKDNVFQRQKENGQNFKTDTLKYMWRIVRKFPTAVSEAGIDSDEDETLLNMIEEGLIFTDKTIFPSLRKQSKPALNRPTHSRPTGRRVDTFELNELWSKNQKRAIAIIKNGSVIEPRESCPIPIDTLTHYFQGKSEKILHYPLPHPPWPDDANPPEPQTPVNLHPFSGEEVMTVIKSLTANTAPGYDGVEYDFLKRNRTRLINTLTAVFNVCWRNRRIPSDWKHAVITLLPKKGGNADQPSDWRPISLLTSLYKIYMKLLQSRMLPWIVETGRLSEKQKGSLPRNGLQEHVFSLKTAIENFKHLSTEFYTTFVDIKDAYGSVDHRVMLEAMERAHYPQHIIDITADVYTRSTFQVQGGGSLTPKITRSRGIVQGCPWSAIAFIQALDPWIRWMEKPYPIDSFPTPCQAYMDDVCASAHCANDIKEMVRKTEDYLNYTGMEVKHKKCATIHGKRTGNNWSTRDTTSRLELRAQDELIPRFGRERSYPYLGFQVNLTGTASKDQLESIVEEFQTSLENIAISPLPISKKLEAVNIIASSKLNFYYSNMNFPEKILRDLENKIVTFVREQCKLNTSSSRAYVFCPKKKGGLGLLKPSTMYHAKRVSFLLSVLNSDDSHVRAVARGGLHLHMQKRKVLQADPDEDNFGGYRVTGGMRIQKESKVNWPRSTFVELNELCMRLSLQLVYSEEEGMYSVAIPASEDNIVSMRYTDHQQLYSAIKRMEVEKDLDYLAGLQQQGRLQRETLPFADMSCSLGHLVSRVNDQLTRFIVKGRLQLLETNAVNNTYYPEAYTRTCSLCGFYTDTNSHALNGCSELKGLYTERHDRCVNLVREQLEKSVVTEHVQVFENERVGWVGEFSIANDKPDLCLVDHRNSKAFIVEVSNPFDAFIENCYNHKFEKYMPLCLALCGLGFDTKIVVLVVGSLGTVHRRVVSGLCMLGLSKRQAKSLARYLAVSTMIGSRRLWARRGCRLSRINPH